MPFDRVRRFAAYAWASPWTLSGLLLVIPLRAFGATVVLHRGTIGCFGGATAKVLRWAPIQGGAAAITLGHTILAIDSATYRRTFEHELVHVGQYERWGVFFVPAYLLASMWLAIRRKDCYRENPFEKPAFALDARRSREKPPNI